MKGKGKKGRKWGGEERNFSFKTLSSTKKKEGFEEKRLIQD